MASGPSLSTVVAASDAVRATRSRKAKVERLAETLRSVDPSERAIAVAYLAGEPLQDRLGAGWATVRGIDARPSATTTLTLSAVDAILTEVAAVSGDGSTSRRKVLLDGLFASATDVEQDFLRRLLLRELRQGSTQGLMSEAVAQVSGAPIDLVRRAVMLGGDLAQVAAVALDKGAAGLAGVELTVLRPIQPMLASTAAGIEEAFAGQGDGLATAMSVEAKLDGARIQVHRLGGEIRVYTRNLNDATERLPEVVAIVAALPVTAAILDGEALALGADGRPLAFQATMARFGTDTPVDDPAARPTLVPRFFDVIHLDGEDLIDRPLEHRLGALDSLPDELLVERVVTADVGTAARFTERVLAAGHEGVMVKRLDAPYAAGMRGAAWMKVKPVHTLDLVVLAVEWGSGRREGWLSNLHLGARDPEGGFVMLGKTFKGLTDAMLTWQTEHLLGLETARHGHVVEVLPELVVEVAFDGVQASPRYPGGVALRFARVKGYRPDKRPDEADTIDTVLALLPG